MRVPTTEGANETSPRAFLDPAHGSQRSGAGHARRTPGLQDSLVTRARSSGELLHDWSTILIAAPAPAGAPDEPSVYGFLIYWSVHDELHILNIATDPLHRRKSVARRLMVAALEQGRARGARLVTLEVRRSNLPAITLYRDLGFRAVGVRPNYYAGRGRGRGRDEPGSLRPTVRSGSGRSRSSEIRPGHC